MDTSFSLPKPSFPEFFHALQELGPVYAPVMVSEQSYSFRCVATPEQIAFEALRTILPPKKFFFPQEETIITYDQGEFKEHKPQIDFLVLFGVHPCDLAGLKIMDTIFLSGPTDSHYLTRRQQSLIVGLSCMPDKHCFCKSMGTDRVEPDGYDIFLTDIGDKYLIKVHSATGSKALAPIGHLLKQATKDDYTADQDFWERRDKAFTNGFPPDNLHTVMAQGWNNEIWDELGKRCLSCGNCVPVCPTCYCFDIVDIAQLNGDSGERQRQWDACQISSFAEVSGGFNFRATPTDRLKFWYRHKLHGFDDPYGFKTCVGCGRCTVSCPAGIDDIVQVVKTLQDKSADKSTSAHNDAFATKDPSD